MVRTALLIAAACLIGMTDASARTEQVEVTGPGPAVRTDLTPAWPVKAALSGPTDRYPHNVLGDIPAFTTLVVGALSCGGCRHAREGRTEILARPLVFEDVAPRLWDVDGDGRPEIVVVESHERLGARLAVWTYSDTGAELVRTAVTPHIGTRFRWLAPAGIGDLAGDGKPVIAYVDRPHLLRELVFVRLDGATLREIARVPGYSNHAIGETVIHGGVRRCDGRDEVLVPQAAGGRLMALRLNGARVIARDVGPWRGARDMARALASCER
ncbi:MAG: VCBS repeat-containing protein [Paracoccaceae bacterium]|nr:MAG: VCBS repeat-containing protein [Paracoccaceae bacterium]